MLLSGIVCYKRIHVYAELASKQSSFRTKSVDAPASTTHPSVFLYVFYAYYMRQKYTLF